MRTADASEKLKSNKQLLSAAANQRRMIKFLLMVNRQGQTRLSRYYHAVELNRRAELEADVVRCCLTRKKDQVCLPVCLSVCLSVCLHVCLSACLSVCMSACVSACLPVCLPVCLSVSACLHVC
ncbi:hypothetical protein LDENG_00092090, partial [Lucifuga dentata]